MTSIRQQLSDRLGDGAAHDIFHEHPSDEIEGMVVHGIVLGRLSDGT